MPPASGPQKGCCGAVQRATITMKYTGESDESYGDIISDAKKFHAAHGTGILYDAENDAELANNNTDDDTHIDVFAHGNSGQVGDHNPDELRTFLNSKLGKLGVQTIESVKLHSCDSNADPGNGTKRFAQRMFEGYLDELHMVEISGFEGHAVTDSGGASRVLKDPAREQAYRRAMKPRVGVPFDANAVETQYLEDEGTGMGSYGYDEASEYLEGIVPLQNAWTVGAIRTQLNARRKWLQEEDEVPDILEFESMEDLQHRTQVSVLGA
ncbi:MAG TPA: hypothetical protein VI636_17085 [Candidatus Angelobacter sp.]